MSDILANDWEAFVDWYRDGGLETALDPLNRRLWKLCEPGDRWIGILGCWVTYARKYPDRVGEREA